MAKSNQAVFGGKELKKLLKDLPKAVVKKGLRKAITAASAPILKSAKANSPRRTGLLKKSLKRKVKTYKNGTVIAVIGPDRNVRQEAGVNLGKGKDVKVKKVRAHVPANIAHLVEKGHGGPYPAKPHAFLSPAYESQKGNAQNIAERVLKQTLESEAKKLRGK